MQRTFLKTITPNVLIVIGGSAWDAHTWTRITGTPKGCGNRRLRKFIWTPMGRELKSGRC